MSNSNNLYGELHLIIGPMFSGKTTALIDVYNANIRLNNKVAVINYYKDRRYHKSMLSTHDNVMIECINCVKINEVLSNPTVLDAYTIIINEGQFFEDVYETAMHLVEKLHKKVYICGLDGDFKRNKFGKLLDLIPLCDTVTKLHANCVSCKANALFSYRITHDINQVVIGTNNYIPLCRNCYNVYINSTK